MKTTGIEWTDRTWNPTTGCDKVSPGCDNCYAEAQALRLRAMGNARYANGFALTLHHDKLDAPLRWREPSRIFVNSMSDLLHRDVPDAFLVRAFEVMAEARWHEFHVLTKRAPRWPRVSDMVMERLGRWPENVLPGVTVENRAALPRLRQLARVGDEDTLRMVSLEPLLESLGAPEEIARRLLDGRVAWAITGGEAGPRARPADLAWFREVREACQLARVHFFHKQHGGRGWTKRMKRGADAAQLDGVLHHDHPRVRVAPPPGRARQAALFEV